MSSSNNNITDWNAQLEQGCSDGVVALVKDLLENRRVHPDGERRQSFPLVVACANNRVEVAKLLLEYGANPNGRRTLQYMFGASKLVLPLDKACSLGGGLEITRLLLEHGADPNLGSSLLTQACLDNNNELARLLLEHGADPNECSNDGLTPLIRMARIGNLEMVKLLLLLPDKEPSNKGPTINRQASLSQQQQQQQQQQQRLHANNRWGTDIYHYDQQSMNALMHACAENHEEIVRYLLLEGSNDVGSPLTTTTRSSSIDFQQQQRIIHYVNHYRVDPAVWYASAHGAASIVKFLLDECGAIVNYRINPNVYSSTPLEEACQWNHVETCKVLLSRPGSDPRTRTAQRARIQAERSGHQNVVELLNLWTKRLNTLEKEDSCCFSLAVLPKLLSRVGESTRHKILCHHACGIWHSSAASPKTIHTKTSHK